MYLVTLARRLSFARAAEELGISQPALTRAVQAAEARFGMRLFDRDRAGVRVTAEGRSVIDGAAALLANADDLERQWDRTARGQAGLVRFGIAPMPARVLLSAALLEHFAQAPDVRTDVVVRNVDALWPLLVGGDIEFFVAAEGQTPDTAPVRAQTLGLFPRNLIVRPGHPLLEGRADAAQFPALTSSGMRLTRGLEPEPPADAPRHVIEDFDALARLTAASDAVWHASAYAVAEEIAAGTLCALPWNRQGEASEFRIIMYSLERRSQSIAAKAFAGLFRSRIAGLSR